MQRIRVSVFWATVAPDAQSKTRPDFDATDPNAYPAGSWDRYDQVIALAQARGIGVNLDITSPAPLWATGDAPRADIANTWTPDPTEFGRFVQAVGTRYSGSFQPAGAAAAPAPASGGMCGFLESCPPSGTTGTTGAPGAALPRVDYFSIWNEPNQPGWLTPQWSGSDQTGYVEAAPRLYRGLLDAGYAALQASGHGGDTILIGETAPKGLAVQGETRAIKALHFIRQLYCLTDAMQPITGPAADIRGCPQDPSQFPALHPGLFAATGYAHHPYELIFAPDKRPTDPDYVTIANLPTLTSTLSQAFSIYGKGSAGLPLYLTEFGYNTSPPNPAGVSPAQQAAYLDQSEFIATQNPAVRTLAQFLLVDDAASVGRAGYGATFQTGLEFENGTPKPSFTAYELPLYLPVTKVRRGRTLRVWGMVRPADALGAQKVTVLLQVGKRTRTLATLPAAAGRGIVDARVKIPAAGQLTLSWKDPRSGATLTSRAVRVSLAKAKKKHTPRKRRAASRRRAGHR